MSSLTRTITSSYEAIKNRGLLGQPNMFGRNTGDRNTRLRHFLITGGFTQSRYPQERRLTYTERKVFTLTAESGNSSMYAVFVCRYDDLPWVVNKFAQTTYV
jgi:hypothetical protein